jgi:hypothetical protein
MANRLRATGSFLLAALGACGKEQLHGTDSSTVGSYAPEGITAASCPNLAGNYGIDGEDGSVAVVIRQGGCRTAHIEWNISNYDFQSSTPHDFIVDGIARPDSAWFNEKTLRSSTARYVGDTLLIESLPPGATDTTARQTWKFFPAKDGLCAGFGGRFPHTSYARRNGLAPLDERDSTTWCPQPSKR